MASTKVAPPRPAERSGSSGPPQKGPNPPVLQVTKYDRVSSWLMAIVIGLIITVLWLWVLWVTSRVEEPDTPPQVELLEMPGGDPEGAVDETLKLESPAPETNDPSLFDNPQEETKIQKTMENVMEMSDQAARQVQQQQTSDVRNTGKAGSASGTGRRALGMGPGVSGVPRAERWFVRFLEDVSLEEYARQLEYFGIELGAVFPDGRLVILSDLAAERPSKRVVRTGKGENRLYMTWRGGRRKEADVELFQKAGVEAGRAVILHFYPPETERILVRLERNYAGRPVDEIRRTYFAVRRDGRGYRFEVIRQLYLN